MKYTSLVILLLASFVHADDYYLRDVTTEQVIMRATRDDGYIPESMDYPNSETVRVVQEAPPAYDPSTQKLVVAITEAGADPVVQTRSWAIEALTPEELAVVASRDEQQQKISQLRTDYNTLTTWKGETIVRVNAGNVNAIAEQNQTRIKELSRILADLLIAVNVK